MTIEGRICTVKLASKTFEIEVGSIRVSYEFEDGSAENALIGAFLAQRKVVVSVETKKFQSLSQVN